MDAKSTVSAYRHLLDSISRSDGRPAFFDQARSISYRQLRWYSAVYAQKLYHMGLRRGDRIALCSEPSLETIIALLGHHKLGLIHVPINNRYGKQEIWHILDDCQPRLWVADRTFLTSDLGSAVFVENGSIATLCLEDEIQTSVVPNEFNKLDLPDCDWRDQDTALIVYTSGTTGSSKGVQLTFRAIVEGIANLTNLWQWNPNDRLALALPLFHVHGLAIGVYGTLLHGMSTLVLPRFSARSIVEAFSNSSCSIFMGVPTMYHALVNHLENFPHDSQALSQARLFTSGSAALSPALHKKFFQLTGHKILERYGMTETLLSLSNPYSGLRKPGSVGQTVPGFSAKIIDESGRECPVNRSGELLIRGPGLMTGYWNQEEATLDAIREGWLHTGDVAQVDDKGYYRILGRQSQDIIKSGGFKIAAREIEDVIAKHPSVRDVAVFPLSDTRWGECVSVAVVPSSVFNDDNDQNWLEVLANFVRQHLAAYKRPTVLLRMTALPRNSLGKLQKHLIRDGVERGELTIVSTRP